MATKLLTPDYILNLVGKFAIRSEVYIQFFQQEQKPYRIF